MEYIEFGKIVNTHALKGEIKVYSYTDNVQNILSLKSVYIDNVKYKVSNSRYLKGMFTFKLVGVNDIDQAQKLVNKIIFRELLDSEYDIQDEYFVKDLEGMTVYDEQNNLIGTLEEVFTTGANDVYVVACENDKKIYLPAIKQVIKQVNLKEKTLIVHIMEGLI